MKQGSKTLRPGDYDSFAPAILSRNHREINFAESISVSIKVVIGGHEKRKSTKGFF